MKRRQRATTSVTASTSTTRRAAATTATAAATGYRGFTHTSARERWNAISHKFKPTPHFDVLEGPSIVSDEYNLPKQFPGVKQPQHITRRRNFLKKLTPQQRNLLLTGDPVFAFDPLAYHIAFFAPQVPEIIQQQLDYLLPDDEQPTPHPAPELPPHTPPHSLPPSPPPPTPPRTLPAPIKRVQIREQLIKPQLWPDLVAASPYIVDVTSPSATQ
jgi:hypothetical protein